MTAQEVTLPSGGTVTLRPVTSLRSGDKMDVLSRIQDITTPVAWQMEIRHGCARVLIASWSLPYESPPPLPKDDPDALRLLEIADYDALMIAIAPAIAILFPPTPSPDDAGNPGSPTEPGTG